MVNQQVYKDLSSWLSAAMEAEYDVSHKDWKRCGKLRGLGKGGKYQQWIEVALTDLFDKFLCLGKEKRLLVGEDGCTIYAYNGAFYELIDIKAEKFVSELVKRTMRSLLIGSMYVQGITDRIAKSVVSTLTSSDEYLYKPDRRYVAFKNCIFDLKDGKPKEFSIKYNPCLVLDIEYMETEACYRMGDDRSGNRENPCRLWDSKLTGKDNGGLPGIIPNAEVRDAFQQWCGSLLIDPEKYKREYVCYLVGPGANGKSVLANVIAAVFGECYFSHFTPRQLFKDSDRGANIAALRGKIANLVDDLEARDISGGDYKRFASGQAFEARVPYEKRPIQVYAPPMLCCTNEIPEQQDNSKGNERRQLILHTTTYSFTGDDQDPELTGKLSTPEARMYIFHWIYKGYRKVMNNNGRIQLGQTVIDAMRHVMERSNSMRRWWDENRYVAANAPVRGDARWRPLKSLYEEYVEFTREEGSDTRKRIDLSAMLRQQEFDEELGNLRRSSGGMEFCIGIIGKDSDSSGNILTDKKQ